MTSRPRKPAPAATVTHIGHACRPSDAASASLLSGVRSSVSEACPICKTFTMWIERAAGDVVALDARGGMNR